MTDEEKQAAEAYLKLHENVRQLIVDEIKAELSRDPYGELAARIRGIASDQTNKDLKDYRIVRIGQTAASY